MLKNITQRAVETSRSIKLLSWGKRQTITNHYLLKIYITASSANLCGLYNQENSYVCSRSTFSIFLYRPWLCRHPKSQNLSFMCESALADSYFSCFISLSGIIKLHPIFFSALNRSRDWELQRVYLINDFRYATLEENGQHPEKFSPMCSQILASYPRC